MTIRMDLEENLCASLEISRTPGLTLLTSAKNCGLLMLINKLLKADEKKSHPLKNHSTQRLAENLLSNFHRTRVSIIPSENDDPQRFVTNLIDIAKNIATHPQEHHGILYTYAKKLTETVEIQEKDEGISLKLERSWKDFAVHFFQEKLHIQMKNEKS